MKIKDHELSHIPHVRSKEMNNWTKANKDQLVTCPNIQDNCLEDYNTLWTCPHSSLHRAGQSCRFGICPVTHEHLECNL